MKLQDHDYGFESQLPENRTAFKIKTSAKLFDILSSGIYKDKILAVIRELSCNAYDAHIVGQKKTIPFKLRLPTKMDPTFYVEDEGTGIDPDRIVEIYWTYGESSKTDSDEQIGALGLGSKSPFAYTKSSFVVKNRYQGIEYTYLCFINENGMPDGSKVSEERSDKPSGVTVEFAVRPEDISAFHERTKRFFRRWATVLPTFVDHEDTFVIPPIEKVVEGTGWYLEKIDRALYADHQGAIAIQGNVPYPIEFSSIPNLPKELELIASNPFIVTFDMGEVNFASSREALQYDERTCANIIARLQEIRLDIEKSFRAKAFKPGMTHIQFMTNFKKIFNEFMETIKLDQIASRSPDKTIWFIGLLLGKTNKTDTVSYDSIDWTIESLTTNQLSIVVPKHQSFGLHHFKRRNSKSGRFFMKSHTTLHFTAINDVAGNLIYPTWGPTSKVDKDDVLEFDWKNRSIPKRAVLTEYFRVLQNEKDFSTTTYNQIPVDEDICFYVNDVGSSGEARFRELRFRTSSSIFVNFDVKVTSVGDVLKELNELIGKGLKGAKVEFLSAVPDDRPVLDKIKRDPGEIRLKYKKIIVGEKTTSKDVGDGVKVDVHPVYARRVGGEYLAKIADLQAEEVVLYVIKRRSAVLLFDDSSSTESIIKDDDTMTFALNFVIPDMIKPFVPDNAGEKTMYKDQPAINILVLNEGQIEWLTKRKVKLVGMRDYIRSRITEMNNVEKFYDKVQADSIYTGLSLIESIYNVLERFQKLAGRCKTSDDIGEFSVFKSIYTKYHAIRTSAKSKGELYAKIKIFDRLGGHVDKVTYVNKTHALHYQLAKKYPMLNLVKMDGTLSGPNMELVIDYIEMMDKT